MAIIASWSTLGINKHKYPTNREMKEFLGWEINSVTPRTRELVIMGKVCEYEKSKCTFTDKLAIRWRIK